MSGSAAPAAGCPCCLVACAPRCPHTRIPTAGPTALACSLLDSLPDIDLGTHLPALLPGLLGMLSDSNAEIRSACTKLLQARGWGPAAQWAWS